ncbi:MAG: hypothetical protein HY744_22940 [Deltaproteobacteria bacterium]|nr:hypothetical protein [Deltaproteobacteria bacterium]
MSMRSIRWHDRVHRRCATILLVAVVVDWGEEPEERTQLLWAEARRLAAASRRTP